MKFKEYVTEAESADKPIEDWLKANFTIAFHGSAVSNVKQQYDHKNGLMNTLNAKGDPGGYYVFDGSVLTKKGFDSLAIRRSDKAELGGKTPPWQSPIDSNAYISSKIQNVILIGYHFNDFHNVPNVKSLLCYGCTYGSLDGIEQCNKIELLQLDSFFGDKFGVLRLLKMRNLRKFQMGYEDSTMDVVGKMVQKQLDGDRDIPELMDQLMQKPHWKPFAKL
jgi:hypothetical protein